MDSPVPRVALVGAALRSVSVTMEEPALHLQENVFAVQATLGRGETQALLLLENSVFILTFAAVIISTELTCIL